MKARLPLLSLLLVVSVTGLPTDPHKTTKKNLSEQEDEFKIVTEQPLWSYEQRFRRESPEVVVDIADTNSEMRVVHPVLASRKEYEDLVQLISDEGMEEDDYRDNLNDWEHRDEPTTGREFVKDLNRFVEKNLDEQSQLEVNGQGKLVDTKAHPCNNKFGYYPTVRVNLNETAFFYSPLFQQKRAYPNHSNCGWKFETSSPNHLSFACSVFDVREGDYLSLRESGFPLQKYYGGRTLNYTTKIGSAILVFYSNDQRSGRGFNCTVTSMRQNGAVDDPKVEGELHGRRETEQKLEQSPSVRLLANVVDESEIPKEAEGLEVSSHGGKSAVGIVPETVATCSSTVTEGYGATLRSTDDNIGQEPSYPADRIHMVKVASTSSSMMAGMQSSMVLQNVVDKRGSPSVATRTVVISSKMAGVTTNVVEKKHDGGGAALPGSRVHDATHLLQPGHTTTSVHERNMSSVTNEKTNFVRDDLTGERHLETTSSTKKSTTESSEILSSKIDFPDEFVEQTPSL